ncbi:hypothetical protein EI94DRAFT_1663922, partial [Lactarius quietus]
MILRISSDFGAEGSTCSSFRRPIALLYPGFTTCTRCCYSFGRCVDRLNVQLYLFVSLLYLSFSIVFVSLSPRLCICDATSTTAAPIGVGVTKTLIITLSL